MPGFRNHAQVVLALLVAAVAIHPARADALAQHLKDTYQNKNWFLANFYNGDRLRYDSNGEIVGTIPAGAWTVDGYVQVTGIGVSGQQLRITAQRLVLYNEGGRGFRFQPTKHQVLIEASLDPQHMEAQDLDALWARIFIIRGARFVEMVPEYWRPCVSAAIGGTTAAGYKACRFGYGYSGPAIDETLPTAADAKPEEHSGPFTVEGFGLVYRAEKNEKDITPPKAIHAPDPEYPELARQNRVQGQVVLRIIVNASGEVARIWIMQPLGYGLDEEAVRAAMKWKFKPARKDGVPVPVELSLEMDFRM